MRRFLILIIVLMSYSALSQPKMFSEPKSDRLANYIIGVTLDTAEHKLYGEQVLKWKNDSRLFIENLQFHLYMNAFKNELSTFMIESGGKLRVSRDEKIKHWGWIEIDRMAIENDTELTDSIRFIQPDDTNRFDQTVIEVKLPQAVAPGNEIEIHFNFTVQMPEVIARTGFRDDFYMVGQWFPKIGVFEEAGERGVEKDGWNCHQYHANSEYYADFGNYDVHISVPSGYKVGATGQRISERDNGDGTKTVRYYCEDVHDFAWAADTDFIVYEDQWEHIKIQYFCQPGRTSMADRILRTTKQSLEYFREWFGEYPYPVLTIIEPQYKALEAGGMEYPTLFATFSYWLIPGGIRFPEMVTMHEFGHQYWYGIVASNEFEEAWLDEGINSYAEYMFMEKYYNQNNNSFIDLPGIQVDHTHLSWMGFVRSGPTRDAIYNKSWKYDRGGYGTFSYTKPGLMLMTLHYHLGDERMKKIMRAYFDQYQFKHPGTRDFINTVNQVTGENYDRFFDQVLYGTASLDYGISHLISKEIPNGYSGFFDTDSGLIMYSGKDKFVTVADSQKTKRFKNKIIVSREGEVVFPVLILAKYEDGSQQEFSWDGIDRYRKIETVNDTRIVSAEVDPQNQVLLDINPLNNGKSLKSGTAAVNKYHFKWLFLIENILLFFSFFV